MSYKNNPYSYDYEEIELLKQQLAERDELIIELEKVREFYLSYDNWERFDPDFDYQSNIDLDGGKLARTPLKNQALLDEIKGRA